MRPNHSSEALQRAVDHFGGVPAMVEKTGISKAAIYFWLSGKRISPEYAVRIEQATEGKVSRSELRPDVFSVHPA